MKKLIIQIAAIIILLLSLNSCGTNTPTQEDTTETQQETPVTPPDDPPDEPEIIVEIDATGDVEITATPEEIEIEASGEIQIEIAIQAPEPEPEPQFEPRVAIKIDNQLYFSDHTELILAASGAIDKTGPGQYIINNILTTYTSAGEIDTTSDTGHTPSKAKNTPNGLYSCIEYDPETAAALGGQPRYYSEFYLDGILFSEAWYFNQDRCQDIVSVGTEIFTIGEFGAYVLIDGTVSNTLYVLDSEFYIHDLDTINRTINFNNVTQIYTTNYVTNAKSWVKWNNKYYSETGAIWDDINGLIEDSTAMQDFNESPRPLQDLIESPTLVNIGARDNILYWIEANTGWIIALDIESNIISTPWRIYAGDGTRATGTAGRVELRPLLIDNYVYYVTGGALSRLDLETGFIGVIYAGPAVVWEF